MRTNFLLIELITVLLISNISFASETYPSIYDNLTVEKNISENLVAGSTDQIKLSFENLIPARNTLIVMVNISSNLSIGLNDFQIKFPALKGGVFRSWLNEIGLCFYYPVSEYI